MASPVAVFSSANPAHVEATCAAFNLEPYEFYELRRQSIEAKARAYCPYSKFPVGSALLLRQPKTGVAPVYVQGANVENAAYPVGTCAERVAFGRAVMEGYGPGAFGAVAVVTELPTPCSPCGMCRQFIREFCGTETPILMFAKNGDYSALSLEVLLPLSFGPEALAAMATANPTAATTAAPAPAGGAV